VALVFLWNSGLLFLQDSKPARKKTLNILILLVLLWSCAPLLFTAITSFGGNPFSEASGGGVFLWSYFIVGPIGILAYLILLVLKINFAIKAKQQKIVWYRFAGIYLLTPLLLIIISESKSKGPYDGYTSISSSYPEQYPTKVELCLTYFYPNGEFVKASKFFLVDKKYDPSVTNDYGEALSKASKHGIWVYYSETGDISKTEQYRNDSLIKKHGVWVYFSEIGDTLKTESYRNDSLISTEVINEKLSSEWTLVYVRTQE
jgi:hypothetical protein